MMVVSDGTKLSIVFGFNEMSNKCPVFEEGTNFTMSTHIPVNEKGNERS